MGYQMSKYITGVERILEKNNLIYQELGSDCIGLKFQEGHDIILNISFMPDAARLKWVATIDNLYFPESVVTELVRQVSGINNVIKYGHLVVNKVVTGIQVCFKAHSPAVYLTDNEIMWQLYTAVKLVKTFFPEFDYLGYYNSNW